MLSVCNARTLKRIMKINIRKNIKDIYYNISLNVKFRNENKIFTHLTNEEKLELFKLAKTSSGIFVEIGSYLGASACFIAKGIVSNKTKGSLLYCVDTWKNDAMSEGIRDNYKAFLKNIKTYKHIIIPLRGYSVEIAKSFNNKIDFIFIDGDHSYEGVSSDVKSWLPKIKDEGIIVFHDIGWSEGVKRTVEEFVKPIIKQERLLSNLYWARIHH